MAWGHAKKFWYMKTLWPKAFKSLMPRNRRCVKCRWVFKIMHNGTYCTRLAACGYSQVDRVDFFGKLLISVTYWYWYWLWFISVLGRGRLQNILPVLQLEETIDRECPPGLINIRNNYCIVLEESIYGLVQEAWQYNKSLCKFWAKFCWRRFQCSTWKNMRKLWYIWHEMWRGNRWNC